MVVLILGYALELPTICRICNHASISSKWPFWYTETAILKKYGYGSIFWNKGLILEYPTFAIFDNHDSPGAIFI